MDLLKLQYFIGVAECQSFTEAAKYHFISQPSLSRQISELESELGVQLFVRSKRCVTLTPEGAELLKLAQKIVRQSSDLIKKGQTLSSKGAGTICIGYPGYWEFNYVADIISRFSSNNPNINLTFVREYHGKLYQKLKFRECDVIFIIMAPWEISSSIGWKPIAKAPLHVVVPPEHYLSSRKSINIADLQDEQFITISRPENPAVNDILINCCNEHGFSPNLSPQQLSNINDLILSIIAGKGITLACPWLKLSCPNLCFLPIEAPMPDLEFGVAYRKDDETSYLLSFLKTVASIPNNFSEFR